MHPLVLSVHTQTRFIDVQRVGVWKRRTLGECLLEAERHVLKSDHILCIGRRDEAPDDRDLVLGGASFLDAPAALPAVSPTFGEKEISPQIGQWTVANGYWYCFFRTGF